MATRLSIYVLLAITIPTVFCEILVVPNQITRLARKYRVARNLPGIVKHPRYCGGEGQFLQWRYETCKESDAICHAPADGSLKKAEVDFIPSRDISNLGLRLKVKSEDGDISKVYNFPGNIVNDGVKKGQPYRITNAGGVTEELKGKRATFQYILYDKLTNEIEICAESDFQYFK